MILFTRFSVYQLSMFLPFLVVALVLVPQTTLVYSVLGLAYV